LALDLEESGLPRKNPATTVTKSAAATAIIAYRDQSLPPVSRSGEGGDAATGGDWSEDAARGSAGIAADSSAAAVSKTSPAILSIIFSLIAQVLSASAATSA
jgi:hypothetical protein